MSQTSPSNRRFFLRSSTSFAAFTALQILTSRSVLASFYAPIIPIRVESSVPKILEVRQLIHSLFGNVAYVVYNFTSPFQGRLRCTNYNQQEFTLEYTPKVGWQGTDEFTIGVRLPATGEVAIVVQLEVVSETDLPDAGKVVSVATYSELAAALSVARPGHAIVLADGIYVGEKLNVRVAASETAPVIIRARNRLKAVLACDITLSGRRIVLQGLDCSPQPGSLEIGGSYNRVTRCRFNRTGISINMIPGDHGRVDRCEFTCPDPIPEAPTIHCISVTVGSKATHTDAEIDYNYFHDLPNKIEGDYLARGRSAIRVGESSSQSAYYTRAFIHHNLLLNCGECEISFKARGNKAHFNTLIGGKIQVRVRQGGENELIANWLQATRGIPVCGINNVLKWNKIFDSPEGITLWAGEVRADNKTSNGIVQALGTILIGNSGNLYIGSAYSDRPEQTIPVEMTRVEKHNGNLVRRLAGITDVFEETSEERIFPRKLRIRDVGPKAP